MRISRKIIGLSDTIRLADSVFTTQELLGLRADRSTPTNMAVPVSQQPYRVIEKPAITANPLDFTRPFAALKLVYEQYPKLRRDCRNREKMIRTGSVILSSVVGISAVLSTGGGGLPFIQIMSGAGLSVLISTSVTFDPWTGQLRYQLQDGAANSTDQSRSGSLNGALLKGERLQKTECVDIDDGGVFVLGGIDRFRLSHYVIPLSMLQTYKVQPDFNPDLTE